MFVCAGSRTAGASLQTFAAHGTAASSAQASQFCSRKPNGSGRQSKYCDAWKYTAGRSLRQRRARITHLISPGEQFPWPQPVSPGPLAPHCDCMRCCHARALHGPASGDPREQQQRSRVRGAKDASIPLCSMAPPRARPSPVGPRSPGPRQLPHLAQWTSAGGAPAVAGARWASLRSRPKTRTFCMRFESSPPSPKPPL